MTSETKQGDGDISVKEFSLRVVQWFKYLLSNFIKILLIGIIGGAIGFFWAYSVPKSYSARLSFVVEESKSGGGLASLAGQFGLDATAAGGSGLLYGENLLLFLKSNSLSIEALLTPYDSAKNYSLADKYAEVYELRQKWASNKKIGKEVFFPVVSNVPYTRLQDSLLQVMVTGILKKELFVDRPEKKASFISVESKLRDEKLSKYYCERLVTKAMDRYIQSKTKRQKANVDRLQRKADSIASELNGKTFTNAADQEKILDVNPGARTATVRAEVSSRDKVMLTTIYGEVVKNLEIAKVQLTQETPTIQIVDEVRTPLRVIKVSKMTYTIIVGFLFGMALIVYLTVKRYFSFK